MWGLMATKVIAKSSGKVGIDFCSEESLKKTYGFKFSASWKNYSRVDVCLLSSNWSLIAY